MVTHGEGLPEPFLSQKRLDNVRACLGVLRDALSYAKIGGVGPALLARIRSAIKSAEGAVRHAELRVTRERREDQ